MFARALELYPAAMMHAVWFLSNHYTLLATFPDVAVMSAFMNFVNGNLAKELGRLYGWKEKFWSRRYRAIELVDPGRGPARLKYLLSQGSKEGLVARPCDWPGVSSLRTLLEGVPLLGVWFDRTTEYRARRRKMEFEPRDFARVIPIPHTPLPCWSDLSEEDHRARVREIVDQIEEEAKARNAALRRKPLGAAVILRQNPHDHPANFVKTPAPLVHASTRDRFLEYCRRYYEFVIAFREAADRLKAGIFEALREFPDGCFPPRPPCRLATGPAAQSAGG